MIFILITPLTIFINIKYNIISNLLNYLVFVCIYEISPMYLNGAKL